MKISIMGGGAWGATLAQVLKDNNHNVLIYDINQVYVNTINQKHIHPLFNEVLDPSIKATNSLEEAVSFSNIYVLAVPLKVMRTLLRSLNPLMNEKALFINVSKGLESDRFSFTSAIVHEEIEARHLKGFVALSGPSHAEEVILRKVTLLVAASINHKHAIEVQKLFNHTTYLRIYTSDDLVGVEAGGAVKNAIAIISGAASGIGLGENARAALITRGLLEMIKVVEVLGGQKETAYGLTGVGDLIVTASSNLSRNFKAGFKLGQGLTVNEIYASEQQTIEGIHTIYALHKLSLAKKIELPMIHAAYQVLENKITIGDALVQLLSRELKKEM